ncbi:MAG: metal-dependent transcriptional regulator [Candidatus Omnitrophica bacterium]|nr:metal-dependent transcriptional regulator [Candidatus Omnitrophota bacterium]
MKKKQKLSSNMEDYLEAITVLKQKNGVARVRGISRLLKVEPPSVASALNNLSENGFVIHERYGYVELTPEGEKLARDIQKKHQMLLKFLTEILNIDFKIAQVDACKMEHTISPQTFKKLTKFIEFIETSPVSGRPAWLKGFDYYFKTGKRLRCKVRQIKQKMLAKR